MKVDINKNDTYKSPFDKVIENQNEHFKQLEQANKSLLVMMNEVINQQKAIEKCDCQPANVKDGLCFWVFPNFQTLLVASGSVTHHYWGCGMVKRSSARLGLKLKPEGYVAIWGFKFFLLDESNKEHQKLMKSTPEIRQIRFENASTFEDLCFLYYSGKTKRGRE